MIASTDTPQVTRFPDAQRSHARRWISDVSELCKARITLMVVVTTLVGFLFGWYGTLDLLYLFQTHGGTALAASGAAALNQVFEAELDARMDRTRNRPLPARRMTLDDRVFAYNARSPRFCTIVKKAESLEVPAIIAVGALEPSKRVFEFFTVPIRKRTRMANSAGTAL